MHIYHLSRITLNINVVVDKVINIPAQMNMYKKHNALKITHRLETEEYNKELLIRGWRKEWAMNLFK